MYTFIYGNAGKFWAIVFGGLKRAGACGRRRERNREREATLFMGTLKMIVKLTRNVGEMCFHRLNILASVTQYVVFRMTHNNISGSIQARDVAHV